MRDLETFWSERKLGSIPTTPLEHELLQQRFGPDRAWTPKSLDEVAQSLGITRSRAVTMERALLARAGSN